MKSGRDEKVPMQPLRCFSSSEGEMVFQVTKSGDSDIGSAGSEGVEAPSPEGVV